ncbi:MAG: NAD(P)/FAD-dependent oxidoreductase [Bacteroidia bacterium]
MSKDIYTKVAIIGAGPAGCVSSMVLSKNNIEHVLIEKESHPRDKVCGDALSGKVFTILKKINPDFVDEIHSITDHFLPSWGVTFFAPNGKGIDIPFYLNKENKRAPGFIAKRIDFDNFLFEKTRNSSVNIISDSSVINAEYQSGKVNLEIKSQTGNYKVIADLIIAADGERSVISKTLHQKRKNLNHFSAGIRVYYSGIKDLHPENYIELHYIKQALPGYLWIFPLPCGRANVGMGMLSKDVSEKKINLKQLLKDIIKTDLRFQKRFDTAEQMDEIKGWGLPLAMTKNKISGNNYMLTGDAASLIDPFTGEGISNAMISGYKAAEQAILCIKEKNFSGKFIKQYDISVYHRLGKELQLSKTLQQLVKYPWLFNFVVNKARKNKTLQETLSSMFDDIDLRKKLRDPVFYSKLIFNY